MLSQKQLLEICLQKVAQEDYPVHSRVHRLKEPNCYIKREDELGCLLSGSKVRKYRSLVAALKNRGCKKAALIGSQFSNHILGLSSLLLENAIEPTLFMLGEHAAAPIGNALFIQLLVPTTNIKLIPRDNWPNVLTLADTWKTENSDFNAEVVPEGGSINDCIPGLATLALDILQNEQQAGCTFDNILIDSGSGLTAASLIAAFGFLKKEAHIHICQAAATPDDFAKVLHEVKLSLSVLTGQNIPHLPTFTLHKPTTARSFGSTNASIFQTIIQTAQSEGFFLDPIYSSKLYLLFKMLMQSNSLKGSILFIHSGGLFSLSGFQTQLAADQA